MHAILISLFLFTTAQCQNDISARARNFSIELLHYTQLETEGHDVISPLGVWSLMTGMMLGTVGTGKYQIKRALSLTKLNFIVFIDGYTSLTKAAFDPSSTGITLSNKNFMFLDNGFEIRQSFRKAITSNFGVLIENLDFKDPHAAAERANEIFQGSGATVTDVLRSDDFTTPGMILINVVSFKGIWATPYNITHDMIEEPFYDENNKEIGKVNMMYLSAPLAFANIKEMQGLVLELPYGNDGEYCMLIIMPYPKIKISEVYQKLTDVNFPDIFARLQRNIEVYGLDEINVKLPRFKITSNYVLNKPLKNMGVHDIFDPSVANFRRVTSTDEKLFVSAIVHKANIELAVSGPVASDFTSAYFTDSISTPSYYANRPFMYFLMHKPTATVILSGIYSKPTIY